MHFAGQAVDEFGGYYSLVGSKYYQVPVLPGGAL
jgi:hypothetical protein